MCDPPPRQAHDHCAWPLARHVPGADGAGNPRWPGQALAELVEAAVRCHQTEAAQTALQALRPHTRLGGTDWALGLEARSRAMLAEGGAAEELNRGPHRDHLPSRPASG